MVAAAIAMRGAAVDLIAVAIPCMMNVAAPVRVASAIILTRSPLV